jgi:hypothetical protein
MKPLWRLLTSDGLEAIIHNLTQEIQENRSVDPAVAVHNLGRRLNCPKWVVRVTMDVFQNCATAVGALPILLEMPITAKPLVKFIEGLSLLFQSTPFPS